MGNFKIFQICQGDLSQKLPEPNMWLLVNHTKPTSTLYLNQYLLTAGNYKSASGQLQNNTVNGAISITINRVIHTITTVYGNKIESFQLVLLQKCF